MLLWIVTFSLLGSVGAIGGAAALLAFPERVRHSLVPDLVGYAAGTMLGAAFLGMIPAGLQHAAPRPIMSTVLLGIVIFFLVEKLVLWRHCHDPACERHGQAGPLILVGDAFHNLVDGIVIAAAFMSAPSLGIATSLAVIAHEVPQEIGEFAILLDSGYSRRRAFWLNLLSSLSTLPGALIGYYWLGHAMQVVPFILALSAASFIYVAVADLIPGLHRVAGPGATLRQLGLLLAGIGTIFFFHSGD